jgi:hypothetical protein
MVAANPASAWAPLNLLDAAEACGRLADRESLCRLSKHARCSKQADARNQQGCDRDDTHFFSSNKFSLQALTRRQRPNPSPSFRPDDLSKRP